MIRLMNMASDVVQKTASSPSEWDHATLARSNYLLVLYEQSENLILCNIAISVNLTTPLRVTPTLSATPAHTDSNGYHHINIDDDSDRATGTSLGGVERCSDSHGHAPNSIGECRGLKWPFVDE